MRGGEQSESVLVRVYKRLQRPAAVFGDVHDVVNDLAFHAEQNVEVVESEIGVNERDFIAAGSQNPSDTCRERTFAHSALARSYDDNPRHYASFAATKKTGGFYATR